MRGCRATTRIEVLFLDDVINRTTAAPDLTVGAVREQPQNSSPEQSAGINNSIPSAWEKYKVSRPKNPWDVTNLDVIMGEEHPPLGFSVEGFLPHGLFVLGGEPKVGKSWLLQGLSIAVSSGTAFLNCYTGVKGDVIYLALEDNCRRLQDRFKKMGEVSTDAYERIHVIFQAEGIDQNFVGQIYYLLEKYPKTQLILVDTLQYVRGKVSEKYSYETEYKMMLEFRKITQHYPLSLVLVTHTRETEAQSAQRKIHGGAGITGATDGNWTLEEIEQTSTEKRARLTMTNRDIDSTDLELIFDKKEFQWRCADSCATKQLMSKDELIIAVLIAMFADKLRWKGSASELLAEMQSYHTGNQSLQLAPNTLSRWLNDPAHQEQLFKHARLRFEAGYKTIILTNEAYFLPISDTGDNIDGLLSGPQK